MNGPSHLTQSQPKHMCPEGMRWCVCVCVSRHIYIYMGLDVTGVPQCHLQFFPSSKGCQMLESMAVPGQVDYFWVLLLTHYIKYCVGA